MQGIYYCPISDFSGWYEILKNASIFFVRCSFEEVIQRPAGIASQARPRSDIATCPVAAARNSRNFNSSFRGKIRPLCRSLRRTGRASADSATGRGALVGQFSRFCASRLHISLRRLADRPRKASTRSGNHPTYKSNNLLENSLLLKV